MDRVSILRRELRSGQIAMAEGACSMGLDDVGGGMIGGDGVDYGSCNIVVIVVVSVVVVVVVFFQFIIPTIIPMFIITTMGLGQRRLQRLKTIAEFANSIIVPTAVRGHAPRDDGSSGGGLEFAEQSLLLDSIFFGGGFDGAVLARLLILEELGDGGCSVGNGG